MDDAGPQHPKGAAVAIHCWGDVEAQLPCVVGGHHHAVSPRIHYRQSHMVVDGKRYQHLTAVVPQQVSKVGHLAGPAWQR